MSPQTRRSVLRSLGAAGAVVGVTGNAIAGGRGAADHHKKLAAVRRATRKYQDVAKAEADGYVTDGHCVAHPQGKGAMGVHYVNFLDANGNPTHLDNSLDPMNPEVLVYEPNNGNMNLVAVEWISTEPFTMFGHESHEGPGPWYSLHAWLWKANPNGTFANFNPNVDCSNGE
ncbi:hypothetical protein [Haloarcula pellucida]|uniref:Uncharacterized protein n=1 Tax=Haloarcula pellucida TaxID=1427151 RepID=A0A830GJF3_9EURY|nr:hypothetical protein [Halomicroarcula pellucida]MBX0347719.1 hypothetical protein [Halomicroarcula pellucida]GGN89986.1 hypothetical protein GCM10009030_11420 [Halomicroarcula pellucida]